jgi:hypothetical protein
MKGTEGTFAIVVGVKGLEPSRLTATDFKSAMSPNSTTPRLKC